jgi:cysteine desulfurase family protein (TIGR01976 family)
VLVTRLDHDANVRPWVLAARDAGAEVDFLDFRPEDCTLDLDDLARRLGPRVRLVAVGCASNAVGTVNDVLRVAQLAHEVGAMVFLDAVHYAPHGPIDVQDWGCDFLACSAYKFFGPHVGILWGRRELLERLQPYKLRPAADTLPDRWMTGTQNHEGLAGVPAAVEYLADIGTGATRRERLRTAMEAIRTYERELARRLLAGLAERPRFRVLGITRAEALGQRVPTVALTADRTPEEMARHLAEREIYAWNGNMYALELSERLGLEGRGGFLRLGLVHYNTAEEVDRTLRALDELP